MASIPILGARSAQATVPAEVLARHGSFALWALAMLILLGTLVDLGALWIRPGEVPPQWEFVTVVNTLERMSGLVLAAGFAYVAFYVGTSSSLLTLRVLASTLIMIGVLGAALGILLTTDYYILRGSIPEQGILAFSWTTFKGLGISALYFIVLVPLGILGLRTAGSRRRRARQ